LAFVIAADSLDSDATTPSPGVELTVPASTQRCTFVRHWSAGSTQRRQRRRSSSSSPGRRCGSTFTPEDEFY
jgi:hypothetical protein